MGSSRVLIVLSLIVWVGCAPGRVADLRDSGRLSAGLGLGLSADVKLGDLTHPSLGAFAVSAQLGFESRNIDGPWYEASVSDPYALSWFRRENVPWGYALNLSGWRGVWESLDWLDAVDELDEWVDQEPLPETGTVVEGERLDQSVKVSRWLPITGGHGEPGRLWSFNTATDLQVGAHLILVNARVGFNTLEFIDFLLGFAGYDIAGDDPTSAQMGAPD
jgi:hypothetical protein